MLDITHINCSLNRSPVVPISPAGNRGYLGGCESTAARNPRPRVIWRVTHSCNLRCLNCASDAQPRRDGPELGTAEGLALVRDLAGFGIRRLLFAGGEPLLRSDLPDLVAAAHAKGIKSSLLTNGTLMSLGNAARLKHAGLHTASILLEGIGREMDRHRGMRGAYNAVLDAYVNCEAAGLQAEIRMLLSRWNYSRLGEFLDLAERWRLRRVVFAHMVDAGRGNRPQDDLTHAQKRRALDVILARAEDFERRGIEIQLATDDNYADGIYYYLRLARRDARRAAAALRVLRGAGAHLQGAGVGVAGIDAAGGVHPDGYWHNHLLGSVRAMPFREVWEQSGDPLLCGLRHRLPLLTGRCGGCRWQGTCGGNLRMRAEQFYGDAWTSDPACYLTSEEVSKESSLSAATMEDDVLLSEQAA